MLLKSFILQFVNCINLKTTSTLIKYANSRFFEKAKIGNGFLDEKIRKVKRYELSNRNKLLTDCHWSNYLNFRIVNCINEYTKILNVSEYTGIIKHTNQIDILKYEKTNHYNFHIDGGQNHHRTFSAILFLNNDYKGGELTFKISGGDQEITFKTIPGSLIIWPSNFLYPHSVKPVTEGTRYSIVAWA